MALPGDYQDYGGEYRRRSSLGRYPERHNGYGSIELPPGPNYESDRMAYGQNGDGPHRLHPPYALSPRRHSRQHYPPYAQPPPSFSTNPYGQNGDEPHRLHPPYALSPRRPSRRHYSSSAQLPPSFSPTSPTSTMSAPSEKSEAKKTVEKLTKALEDAKIEAERTKMEAERIKRETEEKELAALIEEEKCKREAEKEIAALTKLLEDAKFDVERYKKILEERAAADRNAADEAAAKAATDANVKEAVEKAKAEAGEKIKAAEEAKVKAEEEKKAAEEARAKAEEENKALAAPMDDKMKSIKFKDAVGRKFIFPFRCCQTWAEMEDLIKQISLHVKHIQPAVNAGYYDLIGPNNEIILPQVWEEVIKPDWTITMLMWPADRWVGGYEGIPVHNAMLRAALVWVFWPIGRVRTKAAE